VPKYYYHCNNCDGNFYIHHLMSETQDICTLCGLDDIEKLLTKPLYLKNKNLKQKTGTLTKKYIDDNKKVLEDMKKEATSEVHE